MNRNRLIAWVMGISILTISLVLAFEVNTEPQRDYFIMESVPPPLPGQKVLVFSPHPDDESIAVGGYIYTSEQAGANVEVVLVTDGNFHGLRDKRYQEFRNATQELGVAGDKLQFWGYPDGGLPAYAADLTAQLREEIAAFQPDIVVYSDPGDRHPDHATLGTAVEKALDEEQSSLSPIRYAYLVHYRFYPEPGMMTRHHYLLPPKSAVHMNETWEKFVLTPDAQTAKHQAIHCYPSQLHNPFLRTLFAGLMRGNELLAHRDTER